MPKLLSVLTILFFPRSNPLVLAFRQKLNLSQKLITYVILYSQNLLFGMYYAVKWEKAWKKRVKNNNQPVSAGTGWRAYQPDSVFSNLNAVKARRKMIQVCYYRGCRVIYGEKEPLSDKRKTHGLCPKHLEISLKEIKAEMGKLMVMAGNLKVLIVEDSTLFRQLFKETLQDRFPSIDIYEAIDGKEALQKVEALRPNLIFMDIRLPGENGLELAKRVKARYPNIIVIILTGYDSPEYREFSSQYADYFFSKDSSTAQNIFTLVGSIFSRGT